MNLLENHNKRPRFAIYESGDVYGYLLLTGKSFTKPTNKGSKRLVEYICKCGKIGWARFDGIKSGHTTSCGCAHTEAITTQYGLARHLLRGVWGSIIERCYNEKSSHYKSYGGRGVTVCDEWRNDYKAFYDWAIANGWEEGLELDKDKKSPTQIGIIYSPEFCVFITHKENSLHISRARLVTYKGEQKNLSTWCEMLSLDYSRMIQRISRLKWSVERAFETPIRVIKRKNV